MTVLRISDAAEATGLPATTLRYWEQIGLLTAARTDSGYRVFDDRMIERLRFISAARRLDLSLDSVRDLLGTWDNDTCRSVKQRLQPMVEQRLTQTSARVAELSELADLLRAGLARLEQLPDRDTPCDPGCSVLDDPATRAATSESESETPDPEPPVLACSLGGADHAERLTRWHSLLAGARVTRAGSSASVDLETSRVEQLVALVRDEQHCCPFLDFRLDFHGATTRLTITAPSEVARPFVDTLLPHAGAR